MAQGQPRCNPNSTSVDTSSATVVENLSEWVEQMDFYWNEFDRL